MALDSAYYLVTRDIAQRSGVTNTRYRSSDGRYILSKKDLMRVRFTADEYVTGLKGVERITEAQAQQYMMNGGYVMGETEKETTQQKPVVEETQTPTMETEENNETEEEKEE